VRVSLSAAAGDVKKRFWVLARCRNKPTLSMEVVGMEYLLGWSGGQPHITSPIGNRRRS
jgi:hypothetical protein